MTLTSDDCAKILEKPKDKYLEKAVYHENRIRLHTEPTLERTNNPAYNDFIKKIKEIIPDDAYARFVSLIQWPFITVDFTEDVFSSFQKVFEAPDKYVNVSFKNPDYNLGFYTLRNKISNFIKTSGINLLKTRFNSYIVFDLPQKQDSERPSPYFYTLPSGNVKCVKIDRENKVKYIGFDTGETYGKGNEKLYAFFDENYYRIFIEKNGKYVVHSDESGLKEFYHGLGWCPVCPVWNDVMDETITMLDKKMPATNSVGRLDMLAFKLISKEYNDLYNLYPIIWSLPEEEDEERLNQQYDENGELCEENPVSKNISTSKKILTNPGRHIIKPAPNKEDGDVGDPMGFIEPNVDNLRFIREDLENRMNDIKSSISGKPGEPKNDQAKNEKQVSSGFESEYSAMLSVANGFAALEKWMLKTGAALSFGKDSIKDISINPGRNFFLHSHEEIMEEMKSSKDIGMPSYIIDQQENAFLSVKYKNNPEKKERMDMLRAIMPYRDMNNDVLIKNISILDPEKVMLRLNFFDALSEFENKFAPIEQFLKDKMDEQVIDMNGRIKLIIEELLTIIKRNNYGSNFSSAVRSADGQKAAP